MSKNDKNIDAYSKALLDKKTEYNEELKKPKEVHQMTEAERRLAEKTMSSALDMLRKERGKKQLRKKSVFMKKIKQTCSIWMMILQLHLLKMSSRMMP